jgi:xylulokinase
LGDLDAFEGRRRVNAMRVIGGGARGEIWRQILADIYCKPVQRLQLVEEATSLGAALAGGIGVGIFKDFMIAEQLTPIYDQVLPDPDVKSTYDRLYGIFNRAYDAFVPLYDELAAQN